MIARCGTCRYCRGCWANIAKSSGRDRDYRNGTIIPEDINLLWTLKSVGTQCRGSIGGSAQGSQSKCGRVKQEVITANGIAGLSHTCDWNKSWCCPWRDRSGGFERTCQVACDRRQKDTCTRTSVIPVNIYRLISPEGVSKDEKFTAGATRNRTQREFG